MEDRIVMVGTQIHTRVVCIDKPGAGGACHRYQIVPTKDCKEFVPSCIDFQDGPVNDNGVNGCHNEDLIAIVIDRLQHFQAGDFKCRENALALTKLEEALHWLRHRTDARIARGVEGTNVK